MGRGASERPRGVRAACAAAVLVATIACAQDQAPPDQAAAALDAAFPFPSTDDVARDSLKGRYVAIERTFIESTLGFRIGVPVGWARVDVPVDPTALRSKPQTLALHRPPKDAKTEAEIEVSCHWLGRELTPESWLELYCREAGCRFIRGRLRLSYAGACPDWLVEARRPEGAYLFRLAAIKDGRRLFLLSGRVAAADYPEVCEAFAVAVASWELLQPEKAPYAEELRWIDCTEPLRASIAYLASWTPIMPQQVALGAGGSLFFWGGAGGYGLIGVKLYSKKGHESEGVQDFARDFDAALKKNGLELDPKSLSLPASTDRFPEPGVARIVQGRIKGVGVEARQVVLHDKETWFVLDLLGPAEAGNPAAWLINRRALEVMMLNFKPKD